MPKVDIVIPCYNYGRFLKACVESVLEQSITDLRILIIDDASSDDTLSVAKLLAGADPRVTLIAHSRNAGHIQTYNEGIAWATADYFLLLSADDLLVPGSLERAVGILDANPDVVLTYGRQVAWQDGLPIPKIDEQQNHTWVQQNLVHEMCAVGANLVPTPTAIGRTSIQKVIGGYRASLPHSADMEMWLRYGAHGAVAKMDVVQAIYRKHTSNMSHSYWNEDWSDYPHRKSAFDNFFTDYNDSLPESQKLQAQAYRALAETALWRGLGRLRRGRIETGMQLLRFSVNLNPKLRFGPPPASIIKYAAARLFPRA